MNIAIHGKSYKIVEDDYNRFIKKYNHSSDMLEVLYSTMLLNRDGWQSADAAFSKISNKKSPIALDLRYKILQKQLSDHSTTLATRKRIEKELEDLVASRKRDVLEVNQYYEGRMDNNVDML